jgi:hypothetical protein
MVDAGALIRDIRAFVGKSDPATLLYNNEFTNKRGALQRRLAAMVRTSRTRFDEPWGMVCLYWAGGSPRTAYGKTVTKKLTLEW